MSVVFLLASKNTYFNYGLSFLVNDGSDIKYHAYRDFDSVRGMLDKYNEIYLVCDRADYFSYCFLMEDLPVTCLCLEQVSYWHGKLHVSANRRLSPVSVFNSLTGDERKIVYLYFFKMKRIREIAMLMQLKENTIYYKIRMIKIKIGAQTTESFRSCLRTFFL